MPGGVAGVRSDRIALYAYFLAEKKRASILFA